MAILELKKMKGLNLKGSTVQVSDKRQENIV